MSILSRLFVLVFIAVLPALAIQGYNLYTLRHDRSEEVRAEAVRLAKFANGEVNRIIETGRDVLTAVAAHEAVRAHDPTACAAYLAELKGAFPQFSVIGVIDADGVPYCTTRGTFFGLNANDWPYWRAAVASQEFTVGKYGIGAISGEPGVPLALPIRGGGTVYATLDAQWLAHYFAERHEFSAKATILIADREKTIIARLPQNERYAGTKMLNADVQFAAAEPGTTDITGIDGVDRILGFVPPGLPPQGVYVGVALTKADAFAAIDRTTAIGFELVASGLLLALIAAWMGGRYFVTSPIERLSQAAARLAVGDFQARAEIRGQRSELSQLGRAFDDMAKELDDRQRELDALLITLEERVRERTAALQAEIAQRQHAETELLHAQKLDALGQLTGGVAHDFNNLLTAVIGSLDLLEMRAGPEHQNLIRTAQRAAERGARLTQQLLSFSRKQRLQIATLDLNQVISSTSDIWRQSLGAQIGLELSLAPGLWPARADEQQIALCLLNLVVNARDAMPNGGTLRVATANVQESGAGQLAAGDYIRVAVSDTGEGMSDEVRQRVFEPFFTTKDVGRGSGLGLSMVHGTMHQLGGSIEIASAIGRGTTVTLFLPRASDAAAAPASTETAKPAEHPRRNTHVLVVDDDQDVRQVVAAILREDGHEVVEAEGGREAIAIVDSDVPLHAVITDFSMAGITGVGVCEHVEKTRPGVPMLLLTGMADLSRVKPPAGVAVIRKPVSAHDLRDALDTAMGADQKVVRLRG